MKKEINMMKKIFITFALLLLVGCESEALKRVQIDSAFKACEMNGGLKTMTIQTNLMANAWCENGASFSLARDGAVCK